MTDKELLELAAKAAGMDRAGLFYDERMNVLWDGEQLWFEPLTDDGDALRLAVKLGMDVCVDSDDDGESSTFVAFLVDGSHPKSVTEQHETDPYAATRRAIVRAAAEIGRSM